MIVLDASVVVTALIGSDLAAEVARQRMSGETLVMPDIADVEVLNALRRAERRNEVDEDRLIGAVRALIALPARRVPARRFIARAAQLRHNVAVADGIYVAIAELLSCPLVTADGRLAAAPGPTCQIELLPG